MHDSPVAQAAADHSRGQSAPSGEPKERKEGPAYTIGELAREFGVTLRALRFYENKGLLGPQREGLNRLYSERDRTRLAVILKGKKLGFTLNEIQQMIAAEEGTADVATLNLSREKCLEQIELLEKQKAELEEGLAELFKIYQSLAGKPLERTGS
jgi:DNA-binding transcriptional MerR regulator